MLKKIAPDKWKHFYVGIVMGLVLEATGLWYWKPLVTQPTMLVLAIVIIVSYGFELFSKFTGIGHYDFMDAVASIIGGILGMVLGWIAIAFML